MSRWTSLLIPLLGCLSGACATLPPAGGPRSESVRLLVNNQHIEEVGVYVLRGAVPVRVGTVRSQSTQLLRLGSFASPGCELRVMIQPFARREAFVTDVFTIGSYTQRIELDVSNVLPLTSWRLSEDRW